MHRFRLFFALAAVLFCFAPCPTNAQQPELSRSDFIARYYEKREVRIPMRDGVKLHTTVYSPRNKSRSYPILIKRTPYGSKPYGNGQAVGAIGPSKYMEREGYIFVRQDVRGRWMSEGQYDNMRPHVPGDAEIDESSDTYDTIEWLIRKVPNNSGNAGMWGVSYPGFYCAAALPEHHPALKAVSPQAPISDFFFDDFHHHGAFLLSYFLATNTFGYQKHGPVAEKWYPDIPKPVHQDPYSFFLSMGPMKNADPYYQNNFFWRQLVDHPNYDEFWQKRSILPHLKNIKANVMTVGGWFDAEDLYGPLNIYRQIERNNPDTFNMLVMGPWQHGQWSQSLTNVSTGNISFGTNICDFYQKNIEKPFFRKFLKNKGEAPPYEALVFDTGRKEWKSAKKWPPANSVATKYYMRDNKLLSTEAPAESEKEFAEFVSDPNNPVPYRKRSDLEFRFTPRPFMTDDQRFAGLRNDVLVFQTPILQEPVTMVGDLIANLNVSTTGTDADWIVKLIDVYPDDYGFRNVSPTGANLNGYQQMVRSEVIRGRFRNSYEEPEPFVAGEVANVRLPLQDVMHTFRPGHRIMIQVQSSWFPYIDRNPQKYVDNIFKANHEDFISATHRVYHSGEKASWIECRLMDN